MHVYVTHWKRKIVNVTKFVDCSLFYQIFASAFMTMDCSLLWNSHTTWNTYRVYVHQNKINSTKNSTCQIISNVFYDLICARLPWIVPMKDFAACKVTRIAKSEKFCLWKAEFSSRNLQSLTCPQSSVSVSPYWCEGCDGIWFDFFFLPITPCSHCARYMKTTGDESAAIPLTIGIRNLSCTDKESGIDSVESRDQFKSLGKLLTYPSAKPTFCPKREVSVYVSLGEG